MPPLYEMPPPIFFYGKKSGQTPQDIKYTEQKKKRYTYIQFMFSLNWNDTLQILFNNWMKTSLLSLENEYHSRNLKLEN